MQPLDKDKAEFLKQTIDVWKSEQLLTDEQATQLKQSIKVRKFNWKKVTYYAFNIAVSCAILSVIVLLADKPLRVFIQKIFQITPTAISSILTLFSILFFYITKLRFKNHPETQITNDAILLFGAFLSLSAIFYWSKALHLFEHNYTFIFLLATVLYVCIAIYFKSPVCWLLSILMLTLAYFIIIAPPTYQSYNNRFSYPVLFLPYCIGLLLISFFVKTQKVLEPLFFKTHYTTSVLLLFITLWLVSIFGNYSDIDQWYEVKQYNFIVWSIVLFLISLLAMYIGLKRNDYILGNTGLVFFILNLVTRYFEYFWIPLHKSVFFMILALVFWFIGSRAEKLWNLRFLEEN